MVNNAGIGDTEHHGMVHEMTEETWDNVMSINSRSVFLGCKSACSQFMNQAPHPSGHRGWIVNTSSIMGLVGQPVTGGMLDRLSDVAQISTNIASYTAVYCASKGAVTLLTKQIAVEYAKHKIHCNCICPGRKSSVYHSTYFCYPDHYTLIALNFVHTTDKSLCLMTRSSNTNDARSISE